MEETTGHRLDRGSERVHVTVAGPGTGFDVDGAAPGGSWTSPGFDAGAGRSEVRAAGVGSHVRVEVLS